MSWVLNNSILFQVVHRKKRLNCLTKLRVLIFYPPALSCCYLHDQSCISQVTNEGDSVFKQSSSGTVFQNKWISRTEVPLYWKIGLCRQQSLELGAGHCSYSRPPAPLTGAQRGDATASSPAFLEQFRISKHKEKKLSECDFCSVHVLFSDSLILGFASCACFLSFLRTPKYEVTLIVASIMLAIVHPWPLLSFITIVDGQVIFPISQKRTWKHETHFPRGLTSGQNYPEAHTIGYCYLRY